MIPLSLSRKIKPKIAMERSSRFEDKYDQTQIINHQSSMGQQKILHTLWIVIFGHVRWYVFKDVTNKWSIIVRGKTHNGSAVVLFFNSEMNV